jgi:hypothetical protein
MTLNGLIVFSRRALRIARTEFAALSAILVIALGIIIFVELADDVTDADGRAFDWMILSALRPTATPDNAWGPWWLEEAAADLTALGGIAVLGLFAAVAIVFLLIQRKRLSALLLALGLAGGVVLSESLKIMFERERLLAVPSRSSFSRSRWRSEMVMRVMGFDVSGMMQSYTLGTQRATRRPSFVPTNSSPVLTQ